MWLKSAGATKCLEERDVGAVFADVGVGVGVALLGHDRTHITKGIIAYTVPRVAIILGVRKSAYEI